MARVSSFIPSASLAVLYQSWQRQVYTPSWDVPEVEFGGILIPVVRTGIHRRKLLSAIITICEYIHVDACTCTCTCVYLPHFSNSFIDAGCR
jgi:hypothetical protein